MILDIEKLIAEERSAEIKDEPELAEPESVENHSLDGMTIEELGAILNQKMAEAGLPQSR